MAETLAPKPSGTMHTTWTPLGKFVADAPLDPAIVKAADVYSDLLPKLPPNSIQRIYAHWTVGHYGQDFPDYNGSVRFDGEHFHLDMPGDPSDNAIGFNDKPPHSHTFRRNTGAFGIATDDMLFANEHDFGPEPLTLQTLEYLCAGIGAVAARYGIDLHGVSANGPYAGEPTMFTHAEAANHRGNPAQYDNYFVTGERWDLATFVALPQDVTLTSAHATTCGAALRQRSALYKVALIRSIE